MDIYRWYFSRNLFPDRLMALQCLNLKSLLNSGFVFCYKPLFLRSFQHSKITELWFYTLWDSIENPHYNTQHLTKKPLMPDLIEEVENTTEIHKGRIHTLQSSADWQLTRCAGELIDYFKSLLCVH